jgi:O-Antigen ligase
MNLWAFRFMLWYICILLVQPQNRFTFLWPLHIADISFILGVGLHSLSSLELRRPLIRFGPATILALALLLFAALSQQFGVYQRSTAWNNYLDMIVKNSLLLILIEAMASSVERVWAVQMTTLFGTLWWVKSGLRLSQAGATYSGDRLMGAAISLIENPNSFAYMMCIFLPLYLYAYQQAKAKWIKMFFLACALAAIYIVFQTGSRTGLVTLVAMGIFLLPYYGRNHVKALAAILVALVLIYPLTGEKNLERFRTIPKSIAAFFSSADEEKLHSMSQDEQSADERQQKNLDTWRLIIEHPIFGVGVNPDPGRFKTRFPMAVGQVHCEILMAGRQMGLIGMSLYLGFLSVIFFGGRWCRLNARDWPAVRDLGWTFQVQAIALAVGGFFSPLPWHPPLMLLAGSASALLGVMKREKAARAEALSGL